MAYLAPQNIQYNTQHNNQAIHYFTILLSFPKTNDWPFFYFNKLDSFTFITVSAQYVSSV